MLKVISFSNNTPLYTYCQGGGGQFGNFEVLKWLRGDGGMGRWGIGKSDIAWMHDCMVAWVTSRFLFLGNLYFGVCNFFCNLYFVFFFSS